MFDVAIGVACLNGENGPGRTPSHEALSVSPQGALEISSVLELKAVSLSLQRLKDQC